MSLKTKPIYRSTFIMLLMVFPIAILAKIYQYNFTDGSNFGIMTYMLDALYSGKVYNMKSFDFPIKIYSLFKFLGFQTNLQWSIFYTAIFTVIIFVMLLKNKKYTMKEYIYIYASMFILAWTVMNMNKDLIQLMFLLLIYGFYMLKLKNKTKVLIGAIILFIESLVFRDYYILVAGLSIISYFFLERELKKDQKQNFIRAIILIFVTFFIGVFCYQFISYESYDKLINRRDELADRDEVTTIIKNPIEGDSYPIFIANYIINFIRICFPVELIVHGAKHMIFFAYQLMTTITLIKSMRKINKNNLVYLSSILAYTIMLVASESDFGTLVRHQAVLLMFYVGLFKSSEKVGDSNEKN